MPTWIRSSSSTLAGSLGDHLMRESSHQWAVLLEQHVGVVVALGGVHGCRLRGNGFSAWHGCAAPWRAGSGGVSPIGSCASWARSRRSSCGSAASLRRGGGVEHHAVVDRRTQEALGAFGQALAKTIGARPMRVGQQQQIVRQPARPLRQALEPGVGLGQAARRIACLQHRAHRSGGEQSRQVAGVGVHQHHVGLRHRALDGIEKSRRSGPGCRHGGSAARGPPGTTPGWPAVRRTTTGPAAPSRAAAARPRRRRPPTCAGRARRPQRTGVRSPVRPGRRTGSAPARESACAAHRTGGADRRPGRKRRPRAAPCAVIAERADLIGPPSLRAFPPRGSERLRSSVRAAGRRRAASRRTPG